MRETRSFTELLEQLKAGDKVDFRDAKNNIWVVCEVGRIERNQIFASKFHNGRGWMKDQWIDRQQFANAVNHCEKTRKVIRGSENFNV